MTGPAPGPALAVVLKGYPRLSETFIAQELLALEQRGIAFDIWSLRAPHDSRRHPIHAQIGARLRYLPEYLHRAPLRVLRGFARAARLPGFRAALALWLSDLRRDPSRNRVRRFGQACVLATELPVETRCIYAHFLHTPASVARYSARMRGVVWGVSAHARDIWTSPDWEKAEKLADAAFAVTCTGTGAAHLRALAPDPGRVDLVYHGLDLGRFPAPPQRAARERPVRLLSVGRLVEKKGYDDLLAALATLPETLDWRFTHIGGGELGPRLKAEAARLGLAERIDWHGAQDQTAVIAAMRAADIFVLPSRIAADGDRDGLPNVLMEAASQQLPIVSTAVSAIPEFLPDPAYGLLVPPGDRQALAAAIARLAADPDLRASLAAKALARLAHRFGMEAGIDMVAARLRAATGPHDADPTDAPHPEAVGSGR
jgi:glycosyltransferase involved in cell wall biosynthesis